jgi:uncharacterized membrane protein (DUF373 family)
MNDMSKDVRRNLWIAWMETLDGLGYITAGFSFLLLGMIVFAHAWYAFVTGFAAGVIPAALVLIHDLLLVVILLELFRTIINFLKTHMITLEPFLYIGIIASTRRILTMGAETAYSEDVTREQFERYLMDVSVNVLVIVALVIAVYLARRSPEPSAARIQSSF